MMKGLGSTPILEDSDWAWHPEVEHPSHDRTCPTKRSEGGREWTSHKDTDKHQEVIWNWKFLLMPVSATRNR